MRSIEKAIKIIQEKLGSVPVFVAVSGGVDSMLLLDLVKDDFSVVALHVNYHLRGKESDLDEGLVREFCLNKKIPLVVYNYNLETELKNKKSNLQNRAREIRYEFFRQQLEKTPNSYLFVGHHADDQIETFFIQYLRNAGIAGLSGMKEISNRIVRPFLPFTKVQLTTVAQEIGLHWREDESNSKNDYLRNKLRNQILPAIQIEIPAIQSSVLTLMSCLQENQIRLEIEAMRLVETIIESGKLDLDKISLLDATLTVELFHQLDISTTYLLEWNKLIDSQKGSKLILPKSKLLTAVIRDEKTFYFQFVHDTKIIEPQFRAFTVSVLPNEFSKSIIFFDKQKIKGEISMRLWKNGDRIYPLGLKGSKLISDVLTNSKVPHVVRINQWLLVDEEKILACVHHCLDRRAIANQSTSDILCIEIQH